MSFKNIASSVLLLVSLSVFVQIDGYKTAWGMIPGVLILLALDWRYRDE